MSLSTQPYKGVRDFYPEDWRKQRFMFDTFARVLRSHGFEEYQASPLEHTELYESKGNEEIIRDQTYTFEDRGGRRVTLRPEMTPTLARMVAHKRHELTFPLRWFSTGNRFRYERPQRGRGREFYQTDIDFIGVPAGEADIEILTLAGELVREFGAKDEMFRLRVSSRSLLNAACRAVGMNEEEIGVFRTLLDRKDKMTPDEWSKEMSGKADPLAQIENPTDEEVILEKANLFSTLDTARARGIGNVEFDPTIVRGFDYYTGIVFEMSDNHPDNNRAVFGGGRYDRLLELFTDEKIPAVGFAIGDMSFMNFLEVHDLLPRLEESFVHIYIGTPDSASIEGAQALAATLKDGGLWSWVNILDKKIGDQIKEADKRHIPYFLVYGDDERESKMVKIKTLATGEERTMRVEDIYKNLLAS